MRGNLFKYVVYEYITVTGNATTICSRRVYRSTVVLRSSLLPPVWSTSCCLVVVGRLGGASVCVGRSSLFFVSLGLPPTPGGQSSASAICGDDLVDVNSNAPMCGLMQLFLCVSCKGVFCRVPGNILRGNRVPNLVVRVSGRYPGIYRDYTLLNTPLVSCS